MTKLPDDIGTDTGHGFREIDAAEARTHLGAFTLIDVREPDEYTGPLGHIAGASLVPVGTIMARAEEVPSDSPVLMICRSGARSARACEALHNLRGEGQFFNLTGGMIAWNDQGFEVERD